MATVDNNSRPGTATYCLMLLILVFVGRVHELIPGTERLSVAKLVIAVTVLVYMARPKSNGTPLLAIRPVNFVLGMLLMVVLSMPFSVYSGGSVTFLTNVLSKNLALFFLTAAIIETGEDVEKVSLAVIASVLSLSVAVLLAGADGRASASNTYDPNDMAFVLVTILPIVYFRMMNSTGTARLILAGVMVVMLLACMKTASRGGFLGLIVVGVAIFLKQGRSIKQMVVPLLLAGTVFAMFSTDAYWDRMSSMMNPDADYNMTSSAGRLEIWKRGLTLMATHPLGVGVSGFEIAEGRMHEGRGKWSSAHNSFILVGAELGVVGLYMFVMLLLTSVRTIRECRERDTKGAMPPWLLDGIEVAFYGYAVTGFFLSEAYSVILFLLVAMAVGARRAVDREAALAAPPPKWRRTP